ncbi:hypothetical protein Fmac_031668 [Flemingia macrophylla]|uniref:RING-type domain-containing protein n=1 Tax=Flemingia macrophylla TaxID=520843 RepID=A0ABD1L2P9_9FABA
MVIGTAQPKRDVQGHSLALPLPDNNDLFSYPNFEWLNIYLATYGVPQTFMEGHDCDMIANLSKMLRDRVLQYLGVHKSFCMYVMVFKDRCYYNIVNVPFLYLKQYPSIDTVQKMACEGCQYSLPRGTTSLQRFKVMDHGKDNCIVCLEEFMNDDDAARLPCTHVSHYHCILEWFVQNGTCPVCRFACTHAASV